MSRDSIALALTLKMLETKQLVSECPTKDHDYKHMVCEAFNFFMDNLKLS